MRSRFHCVKFALLVGCLLPLGFACGSPYLQNPLVEWVLRHSWEARLEMQVNFDANENPPAALLAGLGYYPADNLQLGLYTLLRNSDRDLPTRMRRLYGLGGYAEYHFQTDSRVTPYAGLRAGMLKPTGPTFSTEPHLAGQIGLRIPLSPQLALSLSGTAQWTGNDFFNYSRSRDRTTYKASDADLTLDVGLRLSF